jgi:hypothetical protein
VVLRLEAAVRALAEARDVSEVKEVRDQAAAITRYLRQQRNGLEAQNQAAELKLRAERRLGELLACTVCHGGDRRSRCQRATLNGRGGLPDGISRTQSSRWQRVADIPAKVFETHLEETKGRGHELTTVGVLELARALGKERERRQRKRAAGISARTYRPGADHGILTGDLDLLRTAPSIKSSRTQPGNRLTTTSVSRRWPRPS